VDSKDGDVVSMEQSVAYEDDSPIELNTQPQMKVCPSLAVWRNLCPLEKSDTSDSLVIKKWIGNSVNSR